MFCKLCTRERERGGRDKKRGERRERDSALWFVACHAYTDPFTYWSLANWWSLTEFLSDTSG